MHIKKFVGTHMSCHMVLIISDNSQKLQRTLQRKGPLFKKHPTF